MKIESFLMQINSYRKESQYGHAQGWYFAVHRGMRPHAREFTQGSKATTKNLEQDQVNYQIRAVEALHGGQEAEPSAMSRPRGAVRLNGLTVLKRMQGALGNQ